MKTLMKVLAGITLALFIYFTVMYSMEHFGVYLSCAVTFGTCAYHLCMRLIVGLIFDKTMNNKADYNKKTYRLKPFERKLYSFLWVKRWKNKMPTYDKEVFDISSNTWDEIAQATCQAEMVHRTCFVLSFLPIILSIWFGDFPVFLITSLFGALIDLLFIIMQRFNRPRIIKIIKIEKRREKNAERWV
ncbi:MAG: hypothetical protein VZQ55_05710 [Ruminococcus sp.]|jgi:hypothetical protein|nr:hypothetical protein [Ruminococcus sp.]